MKENNFNCTTAISADRINYTPRENIVFVVLSKNP